MLSEIQLFNELDRLAEEVAEQKTSSARWAFASYFLKRIAEHHDDKAYASFSVLEFARYIVEDQYGLTVEE